MLGYLRDLSLETLEAFCMRPNPRDTLWDSLQCRILGGVGAPWQAGYCAEFFAPFSGISARFSGHSQDILRDSVGGVCKCGRFN